MSNTTLRRVTDANLVFALLAVAFTISAYVASGSGALLFEDWVLHNAITALIGVIPSLMARRQPDNRLVFVLLVISVASALHVLGNGLLEVGSPQPRAAMDDLAVGSMSAVAQAGAWLTTVVWVPVVALTATSLLLRFPDGRPTARGYRVVEWLAWAGATVTMASLAFALATGPEQSMTGVQDAGIDGLAGLGMAGVWIAAIPSGASVIGRVRRADGIERHQLRWFGFGAIPIAAAVPIGFATGGVQTVFLYASLPGGVLLPTCIGVAVLKYRLYDIDVVLNRTLVLGALATAITTVYVAIVVGLGTLLGDTSNLGLAIGATAVVAIVFEPIRERVQHAANVFVYGDRATPYEVLAGMTTTDDVDEGSDAIEQAAALLGEGTGANSVAVFRRVDDRLEPTWCWPPDEGFTTLTLNQARAVPGADITRELVHDDEVVGAVALAKPRGEPLRETDIRLVEEFAGQAAVLVANVELTRKLQERAVELSSSRRRLVTAQDDARRRLERDVHDGAQQNLVALKVKLGIARSQAIKEGAEDVAVLISSLIDDADAAVDDLRRLARGIYPPLLEAEGLAAALKAQARQSPTPVTIDAQGVGRHPRDLEATVYFCVLEALQNITKHADATRATVTIREDAGQLQFRVTDDGPGFDSAGVGTGGSGLQGMRDRIDAVGGSLLIESHRNAGTAVIGSVPVADAERQSDMASTMTDGSNSSFETNPTAPAATAPVS